MTVVPAINQITGLDYIHVNAASLTRVIVSIVTSNPQGLVWQVVYKL